MVELIDVRDLLKQLSLRVHAEFADAARRDLNVEMPLCAIAPGMDALNKERRDRELLSQIESRERTVRDFGR